MVVLILGYALNITDNLCTKNGNSSFFKPKICGLYSKAVTDQERFIVVRVRYIFSSCTFIYFANFFSPTFICPRSIQDSRVGWK